MDSLNPNHPAVVGAHDHWHKIAALLMLKMGVTKTVISPAEIERLGDSETNIAIKFNDSTGIELYIIDNNEAARLARREGGLPV